MGGNLKRGRPGSIFETRQQIADQLREKKMSLGQTFAGCAHQTPPCKFCADARQGEALVRSQVAADRKRVLSEAADRLAKLSEDGPLPMGAATGISEAIAHLRAWAEE